MDRTEEDSILMKAFRSKLALLSLTFFLGIAGIAIGQGLIVAPADIIVTHGRVYTENPKQPWAQAVAIHGTKIVAVGDDTAIEKMRGMGTKIINASGKLVLPGFNDCHVHFLGGSMSLGHVDLAGAKDVADIQKRLRAYASERPGDGWVLGRGWDYAMFGSETLPHKKYLDKLFPDRPVLLEGYDGHTYWANSKALDLAGIQRDTPNPPNGMIVRDPQTGEATGALKEAASGLVSKIVPKPTRAEELLALRAGMKWANANGITRVHSAGGDFEILDLFDEMRRRGDLSLRMPLGIMACAWLWMAMRTQKNAITRRIAAGASSTLKRLRQPTFRALANSALSPACSRFILIRMLTRSRFGHGMWGPIALRVRGHGRVSRMAEAT